MYTACTQIGGTYTQGFFGGLFSPSGRFILAHGFHGALYVWEANHEQAVAGQIVADRWDSRVALSGHFGKVRDIAWDPTGSFLVSVSDDQTTRLFAMCNTKTSMDDLWYEIARPQV